MKLSQLIVDLEDLYNAYGDMVLVDSEKETNTWYNVSIGYIIGGSDISYSKKSLKLSIQREGEVNL